MGRKIRFGLLLMLGVLLLAGEWRDPPSGFRVTFSYEGPGNPADRPAVIIQEGTFAEIKDALWAMQFGSEYDRAVIEFPDGRRQELHKMEGVFWEKVDKR
jgi:hypothetical protein